MAKLLFPEQAFDMDKVTKQYEECPEVSLQAIDIEAPRKTKPTLEGQKAQDMITVLFAPLADDTKLGRRRGTKPYRKAIYKDANGIAYLDAIMYYEKMMNIPATDLMSRRVAIQGLIQDGCKILHTESKIPYTPQIPQADGSLKDAFDVRAGKAVKTKNHTLVLFADDRLTSQLTSKVRSITTWDDSEAADTAYDPLTNTSADAPVMTEEELAAQIEGTKK